LLGFGWGGAPIAFEDNRGPVTTHAYRSAHSVYRYTTAVLKADREGVRGTLFDPDWVEFEVTAACDDAPV